MSKQTARRLRIARHRRVRQKVTGTMERPRLSVFRSSKNIYVQLIDDTHHHTILSVSTMNKELRDANDSKSKTESSGAVGHLVAKLASENGVTHVVFDRGGYKYHGRVKKLAEAAREKGLIF